MTAIYGSLGLARPGERPESAYLPLLPRLSAKDLCPGKPPDGELDWGHTAGLVPAPARGCWIAPAMFASSGEAPNRLHPRAMRGYSLAAAGHRVSSEAGCCRFR
jgi:hypothetical protein